MLTIATPQAVLFLFAVVAAIAFLLGSELLEARRQSRAVPVRAEKRPRLASLPAGTRRQIEEAVALRRASLD